MKRSPVRFWQEAPKRSRPFPWSARGTAYFFGVNRCLGPAASPAPDLEPQDTQGASPLLPPCAGEVRGPFIPLGSDHDDEYAARSNKHSRGRHDRQRRISCHPVGPSRHHSPVYRRPSRCSLSGSAPGTHADGGRIPQADRNSTDAAAWRIAPSAPFNEAGPILPLAATGGRWVHMRALLPPIRVRFRQEAPREKPATSR